MKHWRFLLTMLLLYSLAHTVRDILQILKVESFITADTGSDKTWCTPYCNYVVFPFEIPVIAFAFVSLRKKKMSMLGWIAIAIFCIWTAVYFWSYFR